MKHPKGDCRPYLTLKSDYVEVYNFSCPSMLQLHFLKQNDSRNLITFKGCSEILLKKVMDGS